MSFTFLYPARYIILAEGFLSATERIRALVIRAGTFSAGVAIIYHEVWISDEAQILLVILGLWLCGVPIADFLDKLRKLATLQSQLTGEGTPDPPKEEIQVDGGGNASIDRRAK